MGYQVHENADLISLAAAGRRAKGARHILRVERRTCQAFAQRAGEQDKEIQESTQLTDADPWGYELFPSHSNDDSALGVSLGVIPEGFRDLTQRVASIYDRCHFSGIEKLVIQVL